MLPVRIDKEITPQAQDPGISVLEPFRPTALPGAHGDWGDRHHVQWSPANCSLLCIVQAGRALGADEVDLHHFPPHLLALILACCKRIEHNLELVRVHGKHMMAVAG